MREIKKIALMAVGDDAWMGGIQYIINILNGLNAVSSGNHPLEVYLFKRSMQKFLDLDKFKNINIFLQDAETVYEPLSFPNRVNWLFKRTLLGRLNPRVEDYMLKNNFDYVFPATLSDCKRKLNVGSWIADFQYRHHPDGASKEITTQADAVISRIAEKASKIILSSKFCEADCFKFFPVTKNKTQVMPFSVFIDGDLLKFKDFNQIREKYELPTHFLMVANLFAPTKNHTTLFDALGILKRKGLRVDLICTGNIVDYAKQEYANEILRMLTNNKIREQVHLLGLVPRADQIALYRMSVAVVQPSVSEGWSTCVEEAKALGKKLLLSDIEVHREQYPSNPYFFSPMDPENLASQIEQVWLKYTSVSFPEFDVEGASFNLYDQKVREFGKRFLEIAAAN